jgi:hypothetical protein
MYSSIVLVTFFYVRASELECEQYNPIMIHEHVFILLDHGRADMIKGLANCQADTT